jgi:hypothetical protein
MNASFFPNRALFWSFWANIIFLVGMIGYFLMDGLDYMRPNTINLSLAYSIYVVLAAVFVVDSAFQLLSIYNTSRYANRYYAMVFSSIFDKIGSNAYFLAALFTATALTSSNTIWIINVIGLCGFVAGAAVNMMVSGSSVLYSWANNFNLLGSLLYLLAIIIDRMPLTQIIFIIGDIVYLVDAILYTICWFSDRQSAMGQNEQITLVNK